MQLIEKYNLPENFNSLYEKEASSSIALVREVAGKINELVEAYNLLFGEDLKWKQEQEGKIRKGIVYMKDNLVNTLTELLKTYDNDKIKNFILEAYSEELNRLKVFTTPQMYGAKADGVWDDTEAIQNAIAYAREHNRVVFMPAGRYKISKTILLNGCTLIGEPSNVFVASETDRKNGTIIECATGNFVAISQNYEGVEDTMFNISDITVIGAQTGFEITYAINSKFERLYALDCNTGFVLGVPGSVGSMFCEFNNLYTDNCTYGIVAESSEFFNNNRFNNGYIKASALAMSLKVNGGYGAVDNVFNNVEFRSEYGRGIQLSNAINTIFNTCYFECGGNAVITNSYSTVTLNNCIYGSFTLENAYGDQNVIYSVGGSAFTFEGGTIFLGSNYEGVNFFGTGNEATYQNIVVTKSIVKNGSAAGFVFFAKTVRTIMYQPEEQVVATGTVTVQAGSSSDVAFTYPTPFSSIPNVVLYTMRGATGVGLSTIVTEHTKEGGKLKVVNSGSSALSVSFSVYAKIL